MYCHVSKLSLRCCWFVWGLSLFFATDLSAQAPLLERLGAEAGLSQGMIYDLLQDRQGFLWFATKDGLNRYDGYSFQVFRNNPFDPFSISDNEVLCLREDHLGRIWAGTANNGLAVFDPGADRFYSLTKFSSLSINSLTQTGDGAIWAGSAKGVNRVLVPDILPLNNPNLNELARVDTFGWDDPSQKAQIPLNNTVDLYGSRDGKLWISTFRQIGFFDPATGQYQKVVANPATKQTDNVTSFFHEGSDGSIWVGQPQQLRCIRDGKMTVFPLPERSVFPYTDLAFDASGNLFVSTRKQIFRLPAANAAIPGKTPFELFYRFPEDGIIGSTKLMLDRGGLLWIGTNGYGLRKYNPGNPSFHHYLPGKSPRRIFSDAQGRVWVWSNGGMFRRLPESGNASSELLFSEDKYLQHDAVQNKDGTIWLLCEIKQGKQARGELIRLNGQTLRVEARFPLPIAISMFSRLYEDPKGKLWILGGNSELVNFDPIKTSFDAFDFGACTGFREASLAIVMDESGHLWIGTPHGLVHAAPEEKGLKFSLYKNDPKNRQTLNCNSVQALLNDPIDPQRYLWLGTKGGGLNRLDKQTGSFQQYTTAEGLPNNVVYALLPDNEANLWLSTNCGLCKFNVKTSNVQNFFNVDGLQDNEFNTLSFASAADGRLYFGGVNGVTAFYPFELNASSKSPPVLITRLKINNQPLGSSDEVWQKKTGQDPSIVLNFQQNQLTFEFAAMDFSAPRMNQFRYRLLGAEKDWLEPTTANAATYAHLAPGDYEFEVITGGSRGVWDGAPARLKIQILPPWWRSPWAYLAYILVFSLAAWSLYRFQLNKIHLKNKLVFEHNEAQRLAEIDRLKTNFFSSVTHEFRTPLTLMIEPARQLLVEAKDQKLRYRLELIENNAHRLLQFVNQLLDLSKLEAGQMPLDLRPGNPASTVQAVVEQFRDLARQRAISLELDLPETGSFVFLDAVKWEQVIFNLLSNALKFTEKGGEVAVKLKENTSDNVGPIWFSLEVTDTGIGISPEALLCVFDRFYQAEHMRGGTGIGLSLTKELVERMGGTITVESPASSGKGASFIVNIPCKTADIDQRKADTGIQTVNLPPVSIPQPEANLSSAPLLLLIEDDTALRKFIRASLPADYQIVEAADGEEGIQMANELVPDIIVSDLMMPKKDGFQVAEFLRNNPTTSHIPFLLLTAKSTMESKIQGLRRGADAYLTKPFQADELVAHIESLLASSKRLQKHFSQSAQNNGMAKSAVAAFPEQENEFLQRLIQIVEANLDNDAMDAEAFARAIFLSRSQLHRKISALTGLSLTEFVRNHRLDRAKEMLNERTGSISEVAWRTGFPNAKYFSTCFKERFGVAPSKFLVEE